MRPYRGRSAGKVPPPRRFIGLRRLGAHGPRVEHAVHAGRRPGQLRFCGRRQRGCHALHGSPPATDGRGHDGRLGERNRGHDQKLRRDTGRAHSAPVQDPQPAGERCQRNRGGHGHQYPHPQSGRGHRCLRGLHRPAGHRRGRADALCQSARLPYGRIHLRHAGRARRL